MVWKGESRRHSLARRGIKTNIDYDVGDFVARGRTIGSYDHEEMPQFVSVVIGKNRMGRSKSEGAMFLDHDDVVAIKKVIREVVPNATKENMGKYLKDILKIYEKGYYDYLDNATRDDVGYVYIMNFGKSEVILGEPIMIEKYPSTVKQAWIDSKGVN